jgi:hypothetical protein
MKVYGEWCTDPRVLDLCASRSDCSASRLCLFIPGKPPLPYPLGRRLSGTQSRSGRCGEVKILNHIRTRIWPLGRRPSRSQSFLLLNTIEIVIMIIIIFLAHWRSCCLNWPHSVFFFCVKYTKIETYLQFLFIIRCVAFPELCAYVGNRASFVIFYT